MPGLPAAGTEPRHLHRGSSVRRRPSALMPVRYAGGLIARPKRNAELLKPFLRRGLPVYEPQQRRICPSEHEPVTKTVVNRRPCLPLEVTNPDDSPRDSAPEPEIAPLDEFDRREGNQRIRHGSKASARGSYGTLLG